MRAANSRESACGPSTMWPSGSPMVSSGVISASALSASGAAARSTSSASTSTPASASASAPSTSTSTPPSGTSMSRSSPSSGIQVVRDLPQHRRDLRAVRLVGGLAAAQVSADAVEELDEVGDDDRHVGSRFALQLREA